MPRKAHREERIALARKLIIQHPTWGRDHINKALRTRFGTGLRTIYVARLKTAILIGRPKVQTGRKPIARIIREEILRPEIAERAREIKAAQIGFDIAYHQLISAGFLPREIREFFGAANVPALFNTQPFKIMLQDRRNWFRMQRKRGISKQGIVAMLNQYYATKDPRTGKPYSPFDFLREVYDVLRRRRPTEIKSYRQAQARRAIKNTKKLYRTTPMFAR